MCPQHDPGGLGCSKPQRKKPHSKSLTQEGHRYAHTPEVQDEVGPWSDSQMSQSILAQAVFRSLSGSRNH